MYDYDMSRFDEVFYHIYDLIAEKVGENVADDNLDSILHAVLCVTYGRGVDRD